ncbi:interferon-induced protein with tetratricopeptide repeats 5-like [Girardinichthys multiradiatus]|uniref:interferon-induced protein with tetratricopeptide repeats 5-like n=1 Tax=Girardinichthys multiradiatus TaxID=208333 RepID=UPI001FAC9A81|nr:interferon-induced protein with tetratricopeptide repeats 5-like [Girardinichthys multiradiatus]
MSSTETLESKLKALQSHFAWDLEASRQNLIYLRNILQVIGTEERNFWLGHIYNLQGFIQYKLGSTEEALKFFNKATETFKQMKNTDEGPWLMVNFGNLAWMHHLIDEDEKSQDYLSKVDALMRKYPAPPEEELHPEVCAEKAWTLMKFDKEKKLQAAELFKKAIQKQPDTLEWQSSSAILSAQNLEENIKKLYAERLEELRSAKERDPDNLCVAALYLEAQAASIKHEARELAERILERPMNNYCGIVPLLDLYTKHISVDEAVEIAKEALRRHPDSRYTKRSAAKSYTRKIFAQRSYPDPRRIDEAIRLWKEVIKAYPESSLEEKMCLADLYAKVDIEKADQIYKELLEQDGLDPAGKQMLYNCYARHLFFIRDESKSSAEYHMKAAEIKEESKYRQSSITELEKTSGRNEDPEMCREIKEFLTKLKAELSEPTLNLE